MCVPSCVCVPSLYCCIDTIFKAPFSTYWIISDKQQLDSECEEIMGLCSQSSWAPWWLHQRPVWIFPIALTLNRERIGKWIPLVKATRPMSSALLHYMGSLLAHQWCTEILSSLFQLWLRIATLDWLQVNMEVFPDAYAAAYRKTLTDDACR